MAANAARLDIGGTAQQSDVMDLQDTINELVVRELHQGRRSVLIIDGAKNLTVSVLESVRLLSNFETPNEKLPLEQPMLEPRSELHAMTSPKLPCDDEMVVGAQREPGRNQAPDNTELESPANGCAL
jgi:type II secretory pathway predicted ATPase ExeA